MWKIKNISNGQVKIAIAKSNLVTIGLILSPGEFCVADSRKTASIDAQERRNFIKIDRNFENELKLQLGECYSESNLATASKEANDYKNL